MTGISFGKLAAVGALCAVILALLPSSRAALEPAKTLSVEQREVDELIAKADSVELRTISPRIFQLADRLLKEKRDEEAQRYLEKGLQGNPWALEQQLILGEILTRRGQANTLHGK